MPGSCGTLPGMPYESMNLGERLRAMLGAGHACVAIVTAEESYALEVVKGALMGLDPPLAVWSASRGLVDGLIENEGERAVTEHPAAALHLIAQRSTPTTLVTLDLAAHLEDARTARALRDLIARGRETGSRVILIDHEDRLPPAIQASATRLDIPLPDEAEIEAIVGNELRRENRAKPIRVEIGKQESKLIVRQLLGLTREQVRQLVRDAVATDRALTAEDTDAILRQKRRLLHRGGVLEAVEAAKIAERGGGEVRAAPAEGRAAAGRAGRGEEPGVESDRDSVQKAADQARPRRAVRPLCR
jgi:hypothetical protein